MLLRSLLIDVAGGADRSALYRELVAREAPLLLITDLEGGASLRSWPGGITALVAYDDRDAVLTTAREMGIELGTFGIAAMPPRTLFEWAGSQGWTVALNAFRDDGTAFHFPIIPEAVRALGRGELPPWPA